MTLDTTSNKIRFPSYLTRKNILAGAASFIAIQLVTPISAHASGSYADEICRIESGCDNTETNTDSTATGSWQLTQDALIDAGYIKTDVDPGPEHHGEADWDNVEWQDNSYGVSSKEEFMNNEAAQRDAFEKYSAGNWAALEHNGATEFIGAVYDGKPLSEAQLLAGAHFMGAQGLHDYLEHGYINMDTLRNHPNAEEIIAERFRLFEGMDVSEITGGNVPNGSRAGEIIEGMRMTSVSGTACDPTISEILTESAKDTVDATAALASTEGVGYSQMDESFGYFSCLEDLLSGGIDGTFTVPSLGDILNSVENFVCEQAEEMYAQATQPVSDALNEATGMVNEQIGRGFAPIPGMGNIINGGNVGLNFNRNSEGSVIDRFDVRSAPRNPNDPYGVETQRSNIEKMKADLQGMADELRERADDAYGRINEPGTTE